MIATVGKAERLVRGPRFEDRQQFLDETAFHQIHQVISLQEGWADVLGHYNEGADCRAQGLTYMRYRLSNVFAPSMWACESILRNIVLTEEKTYLHCFAGVDRTGFISGLYLVLVDGWDPWDAWMWIQKMGMHKRYRILWENKFFDRVAELKKLGPWVQR